MKSLYNNRFVPVDISLTNVVYTARTEKVNEIILKSSEKLDTIKEGLLVQFICPLTNTEPLVSLKIDGINQTVYIRKSNNTPLDIGELKVNVVYILLFDGTNFRLASIDAYSKQESDARYLDFRPETIAFADKKLRFSKITPPPVTNLFAIPEDTVDGVTSELHSRGNEQHGDINITEDGLDIKSNYSVNTVINNDDVGTGYFRVYEGSGRKKLLEVSDSTLTYGPNSYKIYHEGNLVLQDGTTENKGIVKLNNTTNSTSITEASTANATKLAYDKGVEALNKANTKADLSYTNAELDKKHNISDFNIKLLEITNNINTKADKLNTIIAGKGLSGGGDLTTNRTINVVSANDGIIVNDDNIRLNTVNDLTTGGANKALSADMGVTIKSMIDAISSGGSKTLFSNSTNFGRRRFNGTLGAGSKNINCSTKLYDPALYIGGIKIFKELYTVDLSTGVINLIKPYDDNNPWEYEVIDNFPFHIKFSYPTLNQLIATTEIHSSINIGDVIEIQGEVKADDGQLRLIKCETTSGLNGKKLAEGKFLNEIPNTRVGTKQDKTDDSLTTSDKTIVGAINEIHNKFKCPYRVGDILTTTLNDNPSVTYIGTTWQKIENKFLLGCANNENTGAIGGNSTISITTDNLPNHTHTLDTVSVSSAGDHYHQSGNHRHQVDNHTHSQSEHNHELYQQWYGGSYVNADNTDWVANGQSDKAYNRKWSSRPLRAATVQSGGAAPFTDYQNPNTSTTGSHTHTITGSVSATGGNQSINILPPYIKVNFWKRMS